VIATQYKWLVLTVTTIGVFMASVDGNIVLVGLPSILRELNATLVEGVWVVLRGPVSEDSEACSLCF